MDLIPFPAVALRFGHPLPYSIRDAEGKLLVIKGQVLHDSPHMREVIARGVWVQAHETKEYQKALAHKMDTLMHQGAALGDIIKAEADIVKNERQSARPELGLQAAWADFHEHAASLLREPRVEDFRPRFQQLHNDALARLARQPDSTLTLLIFESSQDFSRYSSRHALLCLVLAELCARHLGLPDDHRLALTQAALSMNIAITIAQDRLASQQDAATEAQRRTLMGHGDRSAALLESLGVSAELWLHTVRLHHEVGPGPLAGRSPAEHLARLLRRIDSYAARLSPRRTRQAMAGASASRSVYLDELRQPDEAGATLIKTLGLYPPGSLVRLANGEVGMVFKRGHSATEPMVAALLGKSGNPLSEPVPRDTRLTTQAVAGSLAPHELKLLVNMERLLKL
ncbi:HD-GYP domain-containing protein [Roseateles koreensis]|uniref:Phosphohydrolase n=1 Tax=Roseateles koreensis TaxID=2987526 RepID=A0ABT5KT24_9BURK|nr:phosphohydrolase [Roseateles koreensis]MDC8784927.1 phosphohydrolase [Roseateles koreensis]